MTPRLAIQVGGAALALIGIALIFRTGGIALALGAVNLDPADPASTAFWFQLTFVRLFATALIGFGILLLWLPTKLTEIQTTSVAEALSFVCGAMAFMALSQQIAIWNTNAGWVLGGVLVLATAILGIAAARGTREQAV